VLELQNRIVSEVVLTELDLNVLAILVGEAPLAGIDRAVRADGKAPFAEVAKVAEVPRREVVGASTKIELVLISKRPWAASVKPAFRSSAPFSERISAVCTR